MLVKCPECGKEVSDAAANCPNCGVLIKKFSWSRVLWLLVALTVLSALWRQH